MNRWSLSEKEKKTGVFPPSCTMSIFVVALLLITPLYGVAATSGGIDFEIPINELTKPKKESPPKSTSSKAKKKKKTVAKSQDSTAAAATPTQQVDQAKPSGSVPESAAPTEATPRIAAVLPEPVQENIRVFHVPYSYVVAGKSTVINAVIYREDDLQAVNCKVRSTETGAPTVVAMAKVSGSRFTYAATLPGVAQDVSSLRYTIVVVDTSGKESVSPEFVTPVTSSAVVPGWQF